MIQMIQPVILCGGAGTRLWPESRGTSAKQFLSLLGPTNSLFQQTLTRTPQDKGFAPPLILCGAAHVPTVREQTDDIEAKLIIEPMPRNTAAAIALAVAHVAPDTLMLVMPSDHVIADVPAFQAAIAKAARLAAKDYLVTFGITPDHPDTGFGYIASGPSIGGDGFSVARFIEKPPLEDAKAMLADGGYNWNAGIFLFRAGRMRDAMLQHCRPIFESAAKALDGSQWDGDALYADAEQFGKTPNDSIDYAVMEKDARVAVVLAKMGWSDLGSWQAVHTLSPHDEAGNALRGDVFVTNSRNCLVRAGEKRLSIIGMDDVAVIVDGDDILVMPLNRSQEVREAASGAQALLIACEIKRTKAAFAVTES